MGWRVVVISNRAKLDLKMSHLVVRNENVTNIHLSEISVLMIESTGVSITTALLSELVKNKIKVIFCDEKKNPISELQSIYGSHDCSDKLRKQIVWDKEIKQSVWTRIVKEKISNQSKLMKSLGLERYKLIEEYINEVELNDATNREGHAAKVYFNDLFGNDFSRKKECSTNAALNYGYSIILSAINREVEINGYNTQLGIFHDNMFNQFNLSCDLMEPFRFLVDNEVLSLSPKKFEWEEKENLVNILNKQVVIDGESNVLQQAISIYCKSVFNVLNKEDNSYIKFIDYEL